VAMKTYEQQRIPRNTPGWPKIRCCALDRINGKQCRKLAVWRTCYHGNNDWFDTNPAWVLIHVCDEHLP
jgi:hypothetical protein